LLRVKKGEIFDLRISVNKPQHKLTFIDFGGNQQLAIKNAKKIKKRCPEICVIREKAVILQPQSGNGGGTEMKAAGREDGCE